MTDQKLDEAESHVEKPAANTTEENALENEGGAPPSASPPPREGTSLKDRIAHAMARVRGKSMASNS